MPESSTVTETNCSTCSAVAAFKSGKDGPCLRRGWVRHAGHIWCEKCWNQAWSCRAITVPIIGPAEKGVTWDELGAAIRESQYQARRIANWTTRELAKADIVRGEPGESGADGAKMPKLKPPYLYPQAVTVAPEMPTGSLGMAMQAATKRYMARRYETVWRNDASLPSYRNVPYSIKSQNWSIYHGHGGNVVLSATLAGKKRYEITLGVGSNRRAGEALRRVADGEYRATEVALLRQRAPGNHERGTLSEKAAGGGQRSQWRLMCKVVVWLPNRTREREGAAMITTCPDSLLKISMVGAKDETPWVYHADHLRRWVAEHRQLLDRVSDDRKAELRMPRRRGLVFGEFVAKRTDKQRDRLKTAIHEAARFAVNYCQRRGVASVMFDGREKSYVASFPWSDLARRIEEKCTECGLAFTEVKAAGEVPTT